MGTETKTRNKGGRPRYQPDEHLRGQVRGMAAVGTPEKDIAKLLGIAPKTLRQYYRVELDTAHMQANIAVAQSMYKKATSNRNDAVQAAKYWLSCRAGWKPFEGREVTGANGQPLIPSLTIKFVDAKNGKKA